MKSILLFIIIISATASLTSQTCPPPHKDRILNKGFVVATFHNQTLDSCCLHCLNHTSLQHRGDCEAWNFGTIKKKRNTCELRQLTGSGSIGPLGDLSSDSWKRHSNFRGDCTPLWVDTDGKNIATEDFTGNQQERDLKCCQSCQKNNDCEVWSQATDSADKDAGKCWLRSITKSDSGFFAGVNGAGYNDIDYKDKKPKPYFTERRNMVCADIVDRKICPDPANREACQSFGCCWNNSTSECFRSKWRPAVIMHGMGSRLVEYEKNILWLRQAYPGIYIKNLNVYTGPPSQMTKMNSQMARIKESISSDPMLAQGFNFYGESQGGLQARVYVSLHNDPPVYNLISISGPQSGVGECPTIDIPGIKDLCADAAAFAGIYRWPDCSFCDYWKTLSEKKYLKNSQWLAKINNDGPTKNQDFIKRMESLNLYMASAGSNDTVVQPKESAWHTFWPWGGPRTDVVPPKETESYKNNWLGLKTLDQQGKLILNMYEGKHTGYNKSWWIQTVQPLFNNTLF